MILYYIESVAKSTDILWLGELPNPVSSTHNYSCSETVIV